MKYNDNRDYLTPYKPKWNNKATKTIRVPVNLAEDILKYAHQLDEGVDMKDNSISLVTEKLNLILEKVDRKEKGYKSNSASALIRDLKNL